MKRTNNPNDFKIPYIPCPPPRTGSPGQVILPVTKYNEIFEKSIKLNLVYRYIKNIDWLDKKELCQLLGWEELVAEKKEN